MNPVPFPELPRVREQPALRVGELLTQRVLREGFDPGPMRRNERKVAGPPDVLLQRVQEDAVLIELGFVRPAHLARVHRAALGRDELAEETVEQAGGAFAVARHQEPGRDKRLVPNPLPVVLPDARVHPPGRRFRSRQLAVADAREAIEQRVTERKARRTPPAFARRIRDRAVLDMHLDPLGPGNNLVDEARQGGAGLPLDGGRAAAGAGARPDRSATGGTTDANLPGQPWRIGVRAEEQFGDLAAGPAPDSLDGGHAVMGRPGHACGVRPRTM